MGARRSFKRWVRRAGAVHEAAAELQRSPHVVGWMPYRHVYAAWIRHRQRALVVPDQVDVEVTNFCNAACIMCAHPTMERAQGVMSRPLYLQLVDQVVAAGVPRLNLNNIGEPLLDPYLLWRVQVARARGLTVSFYTNARLLTPDRSEALLSAGIDHIGVSLDAATPEAFARIRLGLDWETVQRSLASLVRLRDATGSKTYVSVTLVRQAGNIDDIVRFRQVWGALVDDVVVRDARDWAGAVSMAPGAGASRDLDAALPRFPCKFLWSRLVVLHDGRVALCTVDHEGHHPLGDLRTQGILEIWNGAAMLRVRAAHQDGRFDANPLCAACRVRESWW